MDDRSRVASHCASFSLSDPVDPAFQSACDDHQHDSSCPRCEEFSRTVSEIERVAEEVFQPGTQEMDEVLDDIEKASEVIKAWTCHLMRAVVQDRARIEALNRWIKDPSNSAVYIHMDWAMKWIPQGFREGQVSFFGKKGLPWHITCVIRNGSGGIEKVNFLHFFDSAIQDSEAVIAITEDILKKLKKAHPELQTAYIRADNAGCYHSVPTIVSLGQLSERVGIEVGRIDFSDPQAGKAICDRVGAQAKNHIRTSLNQGNDMRTAEQLTEAVSTVKVSIAKAGRIEQNAAAKTDLKSVKWDGVSKLSNFQFFQDGIRVWRAFSVGPGKFLKWSDLNPNRWGHNGKLIAKEDQQEAEKLPWTLVDGETKSGRDAETEPDNDPDTNGSTSSDADQPSSGNLLFPCPEIGCTSSFVREGNLVRHTIAGKHNYHLEKVLSAH